MIPELARPAHANDAVVATVLDVARLVPLVVPAVAPALVRHSEIYKEPRETLPEPRPSSETPDRGRAAHDPMVAPMRIGTYDLGQPVSSSRPYEPRGSETPGR